MIRAGIARATKLALLLAGVTAAAALLVGLATGASVGRAVSVGWYCAGAFLLLLGFVASSRGPTRAEDTGGWSPVSLTGRSLRWASRAEQEESIGIGVLLVVIGLALILLGVAVDPRHALFG
jgi:hypothetical protein